MKALVLTYPHPEAHPNLTQTLKVQKVSIVEMEKHCKKGLSYYCDEKYLPGNKCTEEKFFHIYASTSYPSEDFPYVGMFTSITMLVIDGKNNNDDGMFIGKKCSNEESNNDGKHGKHKFRRRSKWILKIRRVNE
jgi:hypothetical protein